MKTGKHDQSVSMACSTCGSGQFKYDESLDIEDTDIECMGCGRIFKKDELVAENGVLIEGAVQEMGKDIFKDIEKDLKSSLKKALSGNKFIKLK